MLTARSYQNVALIGFMGVGKSTDGHILAGLLDFEFIDTDRLIEKRTALRINEIFATHGESYFRGLESDLCRELESVRGMVISTGGGLAVNPSNLESLRRHALVVCLWATPETVYRRVIGQDHRPLLQTDDPLGRIRALMTDRAPCYRQADVLVGVDYRSAMETARFIAASFRRAKGEPIGNPGGYGAGLTESGTKEGSGQLGKVERIGTAPGSDPTLQELNLNDPDVTVSVSRS
jgi:shikimate kinase